MLLVAAMLNGCVAIQMAELQKKYPIQNGKVWIKPPPQTKAEIKHQKNAAILFTVMTAFTLAAVQMWSDAKRVSDERRLATEAGK